MFKHFFFSYQSKVDMQGLILILLAVYSVANGYQCGTDKKCYCNLKLATIYCFNISQLPNFTITEVKNTILLDINKSKINNLILNPAKWYSLRYLDLRHNPNLPCKVVYNLINIFNFDYITSDCKKLETTSISALNVLSTSISALNVLSTNSTKIFIRTSQYANLVVKIIVISCVLSIMGVFFGVFVKYYSEVWLQ
jgi:hypothetical protein